MGMMEKENEYLTLRIKEIEKKKEKSKTFTF